MSKNIIGTLMSYTMTKLLCNILYIMTKRKLKIVRVSQPLCFMFCRKYNRGRLRKQRWVLGGIDRDTSITLTGCPTLLFPLCFCYFLGFQSTYRGTFHSHWIAHKILISKLINTEVSFWHLSTLTTDDCSSAITPTVTTIVTTASLHYFRLYLFHICFRSF